MAKRADEITVISFEAVRDYLLKKISEKCQAIDECWELARASKDSAVLEKYLVQCGKFEILNDVLEFVYSLEKKDIKKEDL